MKLKRKIIINNQNINHQNIINQNFTFGPIMNLNVLQRLILEYKLCCQDNDLCKNGFIFFLKDNNIIILIHGKL